MYLNMSMSNSPENYNPYNWQSVSTYTEVLVNIIKNGCISTCLSKTCATHGCTYATCLSSLARSRFFTPFYSYKIPGRAVFWGQMSFLNSLEKLIVKKCCFLYFSLQNSSLKPQMYFKQTKKWNKSPEMNSAPQIQYELIYCTCFSLVWFKSYGVGLFDGGHLGNMQIRCFPPPGNFGNFLKSLNRIFWAFLLILVCVLNFSHLFIILTNITPLQCCFNVEQASKTVCQPWNSIG